MRLLKMLLLAVTAMLLLAGTVGLAGTEGWLFNSARILKSDFYTLKELDRRGAAPYEKHCRELTQGKNVTGMAGRVYLKAFQLRFESDREYVVEAVCSSPYVTPISIKRGELASGVRKIRGSGVVYPHDPKNSDQDQPVTGMVLLRGLGPGSRQVGMAAGKIINSRFGITDEAVMISDAPQTTCLGASGVCCTAGVDSGVGVGLNTSDCPGNCFYRCQSRPSVVYFQTEPAADRGDRTVEVYGSPVELEFGFKLVDTDGYIKTARLDFGDGQISLTQGVPYLENEARVNHELAETVTHEYICREAQCQFEASLSAEDGEGNGLVESRLNRITIRQWPE